MATRPYKFLIQAVVQEVTDDGTVIGESVSQTVAVFGVDELKKWARNFTKNIAATKEQQTV